MGALRRVVAVGRPFLSIDGVDYLLMTVEVWSGAVFVSLAAEDSAATQRLEQRQREAMTAWIEAARAAGEIPPDAPAGAAARIPVTLDDACGTAFGLKGWSAGGTGTAWRVEQMFTPGPAGAARAISVSACSPAGALESSPLTIDLSATAGG